MFKVWPPVHVDSDQPIIAERPMYFNYGPAWPGGHDVVGATLAHRDWYFSEGCTRDGFVMWLSIQNPAEGDAEVKITYMLDDGSNPVQTVAVPARTRQTVNVNNFLDSEHDVAAFVSSNNPIIVERPMYFNYHNVWPGGSCVMGSGTDPEK